MFYGSPCKLKICNFDIMRTFRLGVFLGGKGFAPRLFFTVCHQYYMYFLL